MPQEAMHCSGMQQNQHQRALRRCQGGRWGGGHLNNPPVARTTPSGRGTDPQPWRCPRRSTPPPWTTTPSWGPSTPRSARQRSPLPPPPGAIVGEWVPPPKSPSCLITVWYVRTNPRLPPTLLPSSFNRMFFSSAQIAAKAACFRARPHPPRRRLQFGEPERYPDHPLGGTIVPNSHTFLGGVGECIVFFMFNIVFKYWHTIE